MALVCGNIRAVRLGRRPLGPHSMPLPASTTNSLKSGHIEPVRIGGVSSAMQRTNGHPRTRRALSGSALSCCPPLPLSAQFHSRRQYLSSRPFSRTCISKAPADATCWRVSVIYGLNKQCAGRLGARLSDAHTLFGIDANLLNLIAAD